MRPTSPHTIHVRRTGACNWTRPVRPQSDADRKHRDGPLDAPCEHPVHWLWLVPLLFVAALAVGVAVPNDERPQTQVEQQS